MVVETCCCGNVIQERESRVALRITVSPCRCSKPGENPRLGATYGLPSWVGERQHRERTRLGLPIVAPAEQRRRIL